MRTYMWHILSLISVNVTLYKTVYIIFSAVPLIIKESPSKFFSQYVLPMNAIISNGLTAAYVTPIFVFFPYKVMRFNHVCFLFKFYTYLQRKNWNNKNVDWLGFATFISASTRWDNQQVCILIIWVTCPSEGLFLNHVHVLYNSFTQSVVLV